MTRLSTSVFAFSLLSLEIACNDDHRIDRGADEDDAMDANAEAPNFAVVDTNHPIDAETAAELATMDEGRTTSPQRNDTSYFCVDHPCPDLAPLLNDRCYRIGTQLYVAVRNIGGVTAGPSTTRVLFHNVSTQYLNVPSLLPNQTWSAWVNMPAVCTTPGFGCSYNIKADHYDIVNETTGGNNSFSGACL